VNHPNRRSHGLERLGDAAKIADSSIDAREEDGKIGRWEDGEIAREGDPEDGKIVR
jgi:hypothetical protein